MLASRWRPNTTVAAIVECDGRYLLAEENALAGLRLNQPAGHVEFGEMLAHACVREAGDETAREVPAKALVGIYRWSPDATGDRTYLRLAFAASLLPTLGTTPGDTVYRATAASAYACGLSEQQETKVHVRPLGDGIVRALWLAYEDIVSRRNEHRSPLVLECIDDYRAGRRFPLDLIQYHE